MDRFEGKVALVTGGARGIGAAVAAALVAEGAWVMITDVLDEEGRAVAGSLGSHIGYTHLDVASEEDWRNAVAAVEAAMGHIGLLVNNAGVLEMGPMEAQQPKAFQHVLDVNLMGPWLGMRAAAPSLRAAGGGAIVNISSTAGLTGYPGLGAYVASKWGLRGLTKTAALELAGDGIRVSSVHPGPIRTPMTDGFADSAVQGQPIARFGRPEEVAEIVLSAAAATYSTGGEFLVDGGALAGVGARSVDR
ncbi:SDR family NAD(P)-dependent oxidoreductase [Actinokineospora sp. NBRC 105648]|uniref:SDR family NAD(P)-dependent oxidoreductase n=1 Tax=Actinokineospora sp. NBRC 105648 TaxID=3032206 RepID=UPI0024A1995C|nr:SDR family NAD(P)-dependent oxidoreductase [Actinokineospora sp. NBRC 105648]GLZ36689.1 3-alpha-hydroxysteroid dehydrogenase [Actinokineospora sp. NBRC 105648]